MCYEDKCLEHKSFEKKCYRDKCREHKSCENKCRERDVIGDTTKMSTANSTVIKNLF